MPPHPFTISDVLVGQKNDNSIFKWDELLHLIQAGYEQKNIARGTLSNVRMIKRLLSKVVSSVTNKINVTSLSSDQNVYGVPYYNFFVYMKPLCKLNWAKNEHIYCTRAF
jgi:hypothetical protein